MKLLPNSRSCFVCGLENESGLHMRFYESQSAPSVVTTEYSVPRQFEGYTGIVHGGIIAAMLDEVTARAIIGNGPPRFAVTAKLSVRYRRPVPVETPLKITGRVVRDTGRVIDVVGEIVGPDGTLLAEAEATLKEVNPEFFGEVPAEESSGWRVYTDESDLNKGGQG